MYEARGFWLYEPKKGLFKDWTLRGTAVWLKLSSTEERCSFCERKQWVQLVGWCVD